MRASIVLGALLSVTLPFAAANPHGTHGRRHDELARRARGDLSRRGATVSGPYNGMRFTYYDVGLGSCGITNVPGDFIVALNSAQYGSGYPGPNCFLSITIQVGNLQTTAQITDECPGCPYGGLDMSQGLFEFFAPLGQGVLAGNWWVNGAAATPTTPAYTPPASTYIPPLPTTSWTPIWTPSTTWSPSPIWTPPSSSETPSSSWAPSSSSVYTPPSSSSSWTPSSSSTPSSSWVPSSSWTPGSSSSEWVPSSSAAFSAVSATPSAGPDTLNAVNQAVVGMAGLVVAGAQQH